VVAVAAFLPWASVFAFSKSGIEGDGIVTLACAAVGLILIWRGRLGWIGQLVLAVIVVLIGLYDLNELGNLAAIGLYLTFLAGLAWVIGALMLRTSRSQAPVAQPDIAEGTGDANLESAPASSPPEEVQRQSAG
jgi:hypothetical protein